jgi:serine/threonine-protein kinase
VRTCRGTPRPSSGVRELAGGELLDGKYRIELRLGQGGMGAVYRATHLGTRRVVAVKVIRPRFASDEEFVERFRREAEAAGRLRHPNVVDVTDFGFAELSGGRVAYLVMEFLDGCTLAEVLAEEGGPVELADISPRCRR